MSASAVARAPAATFWTMASSSAAEAATARSNRSISAGTRPGSVERLRLDRAEDRLHAMGDADHDARTDPDSFMHDEPGLTVSWRSNRIRRFSDARTRTGSRSADQTAGSRGTGSVARHPTLGAESTASRSSASDVVARGIRRRSR